MGRKSNDDIAAANPAVVRVDRMPPPSDLTDEAAQVWYDIVACQAADWMTLDRSHLLIDYCSLVVRQRRVRTVIAALESEDDLDIVTWQRACRQEVSAAKALSALSVKLGITNYQRSETKRHRKGVLKPPHERTA